MELKIIKALNAYKNKNPKRFHMPGHKGEKEFQKLFPIAKLDVTELDEIDNDRVVIDAECDCAKILGAKHTKFLVDGATSGILSGLYAIKEQGKKVIINKTAHKSVYNGLKLFNIEPIILDYDKDFYAEFEKAIKLKSVSGAILTYPDYFGVSFDGKRIYSLVKEFNKTLVLDNAHGGHWFKCLSELYAGNCSDIWIDGAHKNFYTLTQGAVISTNDKGLFTKILEGLDLINTTSPSYPILASIEYGIKRLNEEDKKIEKLKENREKSILELEKNQIDVIDNKDIFKLNVSLFSLGVDRETLFSKLIKENIHVELIDDKRALFYMSIANGKKDFKKLTSALIKIKKQSKKQAFITEKPNIDCKRKMTYLEAVNSKIEIIDLNDALGRVSAENLGLFPPCYPIVVAGEEINEDAISILSAKNVFGVKDGKIKVVKNER